MRTARGAGPLSDNALTARPKWIELGTLRRVNGFSQKGSNF